MSNINVKNDKSALAPFEPFRSMRDLLRWDPFREMSPSWMTSTPVETFAPAFDVKETKESYVFKADIPGVKEEDLELTRTGNRLTVSGKREAEKEDKGDTYYTYERSYGSFSRSFTLPEGIDAEHINAELKEGVLTLVVPKMAEAQPQKIGLKGMFSKKA